MALKLSDRFSALSGIGNRVHAPDTAVAPAIAGQPTVAEIQAYATANTIVNVLLYYTADDLPASTPTYAYHVDSTGAVTELEDPLGGATANNRSHADNTTVAPATAGQPTLAEIQTFVTGATLTDTIVYYTGDDLPASVPTYVYDVDGLGVATLVLQPSAAANNISHADDTTVAPAIANNPSLAEIQTFVTGATLTDVVVYYTGNDTATLATATHVYYVDAAGNTVLLQEPAAAQVAWSVVNAAGALGAGDYILDSSGAAFAVTLTEEIGEWEFSEPRRISATNNIDIGTAAQTFTDNTGVQVAGPLTINLDGAHFKLVNTDGSANFYLVFFTTGGGAASGAIDGLTDVDTTTVAPNLTDILNWDGANWVPTANVSSSPWTTVSAAGALNKGDYLLDSSGAAFAVTLVEEIGEWEFSDSVYQTGTNNVTIGTAAQTFTNESGVSVAGPVIVDSNGTHFKIVNTDGSANFSIVGNPSGGSAVGGTPLNHAIFSYGGNSDNISTGFDIPWNGFQSFGGITQSGNGIVLPQSVIPYILECDLGFDYDGSPGGDDMRFRWTNGAGTPVGTQNMGALLSTFDDSPDTVDDRKLHCSAVVDASAGDVTVFVEATDGGHDVFDVFAKAYQLPASTVTSTQLQAVHRFQVSSANTTVSKDQFWVVGGAHTMTLPAGASDGDSVVFGPSNADWSTLGASFSTTDTATIAAGQVGVPSDSDLVTFVYIAATDNWLMLL